MDRRTRKRLRKIREDIAQLNAEWDDAVKGGECEEGQGRTDEFQKRKTWLETDEKKLVSGSLEREASRLWIPLPPKEDRARWENAEGYMGWDYATVLRPLGMTELRTAIRKERAERRAVTEWWLKTLGAAVGILTGLIGALIGLVSVLRK